MRVMFSFFYGKHRNVCELVTTFSWQNMTFLVSCLSHLYHHSELGMISPILAGIVSLFFDGFCSKSLWHLWLQSSFHHPGFGTISIAPTSHFGGLNRRFLWVPSPILGEPLCIYTHTPLIYVYIYILYVCMYVM